jgi:predicted RNA-binding Zn ribbon-like protein
MPRAVPSRSFVPDEPFRFVGGHVAADLVNTVTWEVAGPVRDRLSDYPRILEWASAAGVIDGATAATLGAAAASRPAEADVAYRAARWTRDVLHRLLTAVGDGTLTTPKGERALAELNALLSTALRPLRLVAPGHSPGGRAPLVRLGGAPTALAWQWEGGGGRLDAVLWPVIWQAAELLTSEDAAQLRVCGGVECGWVYVDRSRNGLRRWCEMQTCGTAEKSRRRTERHRRHG